MRTLTYNGGIFDEGNGWIFRKVMNWTFPGLLLAAAEIGLINAGILSEGKIPRPAMTVILIFTVIYVIPSVFAFPTAWFLSWGRTRLCRESWIDLYKKKIVYHKAVSMTMGKPRYVDFSVTQLRKVEVKRGEYVLHGAVTNETVGGSGGELKIPVAFENMQAIREMARYK